MTKNGQNWSKNGRYKKNIFLINKVKLKQLLAKQFGASEGVAGQLSFFHYFYLPPVLEYCQISKKIIFSRMIFFEALV